jgi:hypothetical protein
LESHSAVEGFVAGSLGKSIDSGVHADVSACLRDIAECAIGATAIAGRNGAVAACSLGAKSRRPTRLGSNPRPKECVFDGAAAQAELPPDLAKRIETNGHAFRDMD